MHCISLDRARLRVAGFRPRAGGLPALGVVFALYLALRERE
jgi:hypothetical protein